MKEFIKKMFQDEHGNPSSKRVSGFICVLALVIALLLNTITCGGVKPSDSLIDAVALFAFGALGLTSIDKFTKNKYKD